MHIMQLFAILMYKLSMPLPMRGLRTGQRACIHAATRVSCNQLAKIHTLNCRLGRF